MTTDERFERIERCMADISEQWIKERDEDRLLLRETQQHLDELALRISEGDERLGKRIDQLAEEAAARDREAHERDRQLGLRIEALVSAMGEFLAKLQKN
jgi:hypothetical protein